MNEDNFPKTYYFTFGISGNHAFNGGWVKVIATGKASAIQTFLKAYPRAAGSMTLHIADIYTAEEFANTGMLEKETSESSSKARRFLVRRWGWGNAVLSFLERRKRQHSGGDIGSHSRATAFNNSFSEVMFDRKRGISGERPEHIDFIKNKAKPLFESWGYTVEILHAEKDYLDCFFEFLKIKR